VSAFDEDAEMTHLLQDNGDPFPGASDQHYGSKMSSSHGNSQGVAVALAADAPMAGSQAMAAPTATTSAMRPSPQASCLVRSRHECAAKLEQMTRGTGIGVACGSNESGGVVGDPAQMLADACQQYFRRVIGDVQRYVVVQYENYFPNLCLHCFSGILAKVNQTSHHLISYLFVCLNLLNFCS